MHEQYTAFKQCRGVRKCPGCRCPAPITNRKCGCCGRWPDALPCTVCGLLGRFDTDMLVTTDGPIHDTCWVGRIGIVMSLEEFDRATRDLEDPPE